MPNSCTSAPALATRDDPQAAACKMPGSLPPRPSMPARTPRPGALPTPTGTHDRAQRVVGHVRDILRLLKEHAKQVEARAGLARAQVWTLSAIAAAGEIGVSELAQTMGLHQSTTSNLIRPLQEQGLVSGRRDPDDRRLLRLTAQGRRALTRVPGPYRGLLAESLEQLDDATLRSLDRDLARLLQVMGGEEAAAPPAAKARPRKAPARKRA